MKDIYESISSFLPPVFNMNPLLERAIRVTSEGDLREINVESRTLKIFTDSKSYPDLKLDFAGLSLQEVVDAINAISGLSAILTYEDGSVSALRLIKPENDWDDAVIESASG